MQCLVRDFISVPVPKPAGILHVEILNDRYHALHGLVNIRVPEPARQLSLHPSRTYSHDRNFASLVFKVHSNRLSFLVQSSLAQLVPNLRSIVVDFVDS